MRNLLVISEIILDNAITDKNAAKDFSVSIFDCSNSRDLA